MKSHDHQHINKDPLADSAGVPWDGRAFSENPFANDDGSARPELISAIAEFQKTGNPNQVFIEIAKSRLLIPLLADLGESEVGAHGQTVDKSADLSIVTVQTPDNKTALPVFSSVETMKRWNSKARPVPSDAIRVALAAASEGTERVVLDPGSETEFAMRRPAIAALAQQQPWRAPHLDEAVLAEYKKGALVEEHVVDLTTAAGDPTSRLAGSELVVTIFVKQGLASADLEVILHRIMERWAASELIASAVDSMTLVVKPVS